jgi:hypothetical protein
MTATSAEPLNGWRYFPQVLTKALTLIPAGETLDFEVAVVLLYALAKIVRVEKIHQLKENSFSGIHGRVPP